jgi:hypothetical protein
MLLEPIWVEPGQSAVGRRLTGKGRMDAFVARFGNGRPWRNPPSAKVRFLELTARLLGRS